MFDAEVFSGGGCDFGLIIFLLGKAYCESLDFLAEATNEPRENCIGINPPA